MERKQRAADISRLKEAFQKVFVNSDPFGDPFQDTLIEKVLIFPTNGYYLQENQFHALMTTIEKVGDGTFYVSESEGDSFNLSQNFHFELAPHHWIAESTIQYEDYHSIPLVVENGIYSPQGQWGLMVSHENHGVLAGDASFIGTFKDAYPQWEEDTKRFVQFWEGIGKEYHADIAWVEGFLEQF